MIRRETKANSFVSRRTDLNNTQLRGLVPFIEIAGSERAGTSALLTRLRIFPAWNATMIKGEVLNWRFKGRRLHAMSR